MSMSFHRRMAKSSSEPILVGASLSLSGQFAAQGRQARDGLTLWAEARNRSGGLVVVSGEPRRPIRLIVHDDASKKADASANTRRLIAEDRVDLLFGPYSSVLSLAAAEVAAASDRTLWNHGGSSDSMVGRGWTHVVNLLSPASSYFVPLLDMAVQTAHRPIRRVVLVHGARGTFPRAVIDGAERHARRLGLDIVAKATYPEAAEGDRTSLPGLDERVSLDAGAFPRLVRTVAALAPDVILGAGTTEADIAFARELRTQGVGAAVVGLVAAAVQPFQDALRPDADGFYGPSQWEPSISDWPELGPRSQEFAATFNARFGYAPDYTAAQAYAAGLVAGRCIGLAASVDDLALRAQAARLDMTTFYGRFRTDPSTGQQIGHQVVAVQWRHGKKEVVWPLVVPPRWA